LIWSQPERFNFLVLEQLKKRLKDSHSIELGSKATPLALIALKKVKELKA
jgi:hypothetical protein